MKIEKVAGGGYRITDGAEAVDFDRERFEDLFYAVPLDTTSFYRLLTESVCRTDDERGRMVAMIEKLEDQDAGLQALQERITKLGI